MASSGYTPEYSEFKRLLSSGAPLDAATLAERQCGLPGENREFWLTQLATALRAGGKHARALEAASEALKIAPHNLYALLARADALTAGGKHAEALADYEEAARSPNPRIAERGRKGFLETLVRTKAWERILGLIPSFTVDERERVRWRVKALAGLKRTREAIDECVAWLKLSPDDPSALWELTHLQVAEEGLEPVLARMARMAKIPSKPQVYREIYASLSRKAGNNDEAVDQYKDLASAGNTPQLMRKQAFALAKSGGEKTAIPMLEELLRLTPNDMYMHTSYFASCNRIHELERAWKFYHELMGKFPDEKGLYGRIKKVEKMLREGGAVGPEKTEDSTVGDQQTTLK